MTGIVGGFQHRLGDFTLDAALECPGRGVTVLAGPSGSGKSTLLRCLAGLERAARGHCEVHGEVWQDSARGIFLPPHRRRVGYVFQQANLFPHLSVRQNLEFGWRRLPPGERKIEPEQAIRMMGLAHLLDRRPGSLSGGEGQRVAIARALLTSARLLLMDEPLSSLDPAGKREIYPYLERLHAELETPLLYVSHDPHEIARIADGIILLDRGRVVASGEMAEIMTRLDLGLAQSEQAMAVVEAQVAEHDHYYGLSVLSFSGGRLLIPRLPNPVGSRVRAGILARDVSLALTAHADSSILNIFPARVIEKREDGEGHVLVRLDASGTRLLARITRKSAHLLGVLPGAALYVQLKSVAIMP